MGIYDAAFGLDEESRELAKSMGESPAEKMSQLAVLKQWIMTHNYMTCRTDDAFLLRFLRVSKFSCERAKERIEKWCMMRSSELDGFPIAFARQNMKDPKMREILEKGIMYFVPKVDDLGRIIMVFDLCKMASEKLDQEDFMQATYMLLDYIMFTYDRMQINGFVVLEIGTSNLDMSMLTYWTPDKMRRGMNLWTDCIPIRLKGVEYYNMPKVLKAFLETFLGLMKPKLRKRVTFHSDQKPAENIPADIMPPGLGGTSYTWEELKEELLRDMEKFQPEFDSLKMCRVDDAKRPKKYEEGDSWGISGTYRQMESQD